MPLQPVYALPGLCLVNSPYASGKQFGFTAGRYATGRYTAGNNVEFVAGFPQKVAGYTAAVSSGITGIPRCLKSWRDNAGNPRLAIATENHVYSWDGVHSVVDITPFATWKSGSLPTNNPLTTTNGSSTVVVADTTANLVNGDYVFLKAGSGAFNGVVVAGWYQIFAFTAGTGYSITVNSNATAGSSGGGTVAYSYPRGKLGANPFATQNNSNVVTVTDTTFTATQGQFVDFSGATAFNNVTISGEYQIQSVTGSTYTINAATTANATGSGGGSAVLVTYDVLPSQAAIGSGSGYGSGGYGQGGFGSQMSFAQQLPLGWTLAAYGNNMSICAIGGTIYFYNPGASITANNRAFPLYNAPTNCAAHFITPERFVVALGAENTADGSAGSLLNVAWSDQNDPTQWISTPTNTAETGRTLQGGDFFVGGIGVRDGTSLIFTNRCTFQMSYTGDVLIYDTPMVADNAGLVSPFALVAIGGFAYWQGDADFWTWTGSVAPLPTDDIREFVYQNTTAFPGINRGFLYKCAAGTNRLKNQIRFFYPDNSSTEPNRFMIYDIEQQVWGAGQRQILCWEDNNLSTGPFSGDTTSTIYLEESGVDANGGALDSSLTFSPVDVSNGDANVDFFGFIPDFQRISGVQTLTTSTQYYPEDTPSTQQFTVSDPTTRIDLRADGKLIGWALDSDAIGADWRMGLHRIDFQPAGLRK